MVCNIAAPRVKTMSSCRATSFYLSPGVLRYFKDYTLAAVLPDGSWVEIKHRGDIARLKQEHPLWGGTVLCGPRGRGGLRELRSDIEEDGRSVEVWDINHRIIEGRRPENAAAYVLHKWAVTGDTQAVGGVRQLIETIAPGVPRSVRNALEAAALRGEHQAVDVVAAAWRAGLLRNPDQIVELLKHSRIPLRSVPDPRLEQLLAGIVATGRDVDAVAFISSMIDGSQMLNAGTGLLLAKDTTTSSAVLQVLALNGNYDTRQYVAQNPNTPVATLLQLSGDSDELVRSNVAENPNTPVATLLQLAKDENKSVRSNVARNPNTPPAAILRLSKDANESVRNAVTHNLSTPVPLLEQLSRDTDKSVRSNVARAPNTPVAALLQLSQDENESVRSNVARNPYTPVAALLQLSKDANESVRSAVACNPYTPFSVLEQLSRDSGATVRRDVADNPSTPVAVLEQLATSPAVGHPGRTRDSDGYGGVRSAVAENPHTPVAVLEQLSKNSGKLVQMAVAKNPHTPVAVLEQLSKNSEVVVRLYVAENPNTPPAAILRLSKDEDESVRSWLAKNPHAPVAVLEQLAKDEDEWVRSAVACNPSTPVATLLQLSGDSDELVRDAVTQNPSTPVSLLEQLATSAWHADRVEHHAIKNGIPLELHSTLDLAYHDLVQYGASAADYPDVIAAVGDVGRANMSFRFSDDTLKLRHTFAESTVQVGDAVLTPRVISSRRELTENSNYMGNCTSGYEADIRLDESLIIALDDTSSTSRDTLYNVEIKRGPDGRWDTIGEINSRFNKGATDEVRRTLKARLTEILRSV